MATDFDAVRKISEQLEDRDRDRHFAHKRLRDFWHGRYWDTVDTGSHTVSSIFRDLTAKQSDVGPDVKLVHNLVHAICVKFQSFLSDTPMIRVYVDPPESNTRRQQATLKERALYALWNDVRMNGILNQIGWYLPLMGDCFLGTIPDFDRSVPVPVLRSPEYAFPVPGFDGRSLDAVVFKWEIPESTALRNFPKYTARADRQNNQRSRLGLRGMQKSQKADPSVEVLEYSDDKQWTRWVDGVEVNGVEHNFGFNLFEQMSFINVPDEPWNHGAVEQTVNMNEMHNALLSLMFQSVLENVFPRLVLIDPAKAPEEIETGPGAVIPINQGGNVAWLHPPVQALGAQAGFMNENIHNIKEASGMPDVNFGVAPTSSIATGKAINELQGAGTGSMVEMVQGTGIGVGLTSWNSKALFMWQTIFRNDSISLGGMIPQSSMDLAGRMATLKFKGSQIVGSQRNEVVFAPAISQHEKLVMWLQAKGGGLVSDKFIREQIGIPDSEAMEEEIIGEAVTQAVIGAVLGSLQQDPSAGNAAQVEDQAFAYLQGQTAQPKQPPAQPGSPLMLQNKPAPPAAGPLAGAGPPPPGTAPPGGPAPAPPQAGPPQAGPPQAQGDNSINLNDAIGAFQQVQGLTGRVFLVGQIVDSGQTDSDIEVAVTDPGDQQVLSDSLKQFQGRLVFHQVQGEPNEPFVEVTPGKPARPGGGAGGQQGQPPAPPDQGVSSMANRDQGITPRSSSSLNSVA